MPTDYLVYWLTLPCGLLLIGILIAISFYFWRYVLGGEYIHIGMKPLVLGYVCALAGHIIASFISSYIDFSSRVANGILQESIRWSWLLYSTTYRSVLSLILVLPLLGFVGVPFAALLTRFHRLSYWSIAASVTGLWLTFSCTLWYVSVNNAWGAKWEPAHPVETFINSLVGFLPSMVFVAAPFLLAIYQATYSFRQIEAGKMQNIT